MTAPIVFVLKGYPRLSETFIAEEIANLEAAGMPIHIVSLRHPTDRKRHPVHAAIRAPVTYLPEYLHHEPLRVLRAAWRLRGARTLGAVLRGFGRDLARDPTRNRVRRLGQAMVLAAEVPARHLHAHFIHTPASVAAYAAALTGLRWSCSAHAKDIWTTAERELRHKLRAAIFTVTCTAAGQARLQALAPPGKPVRLSYHGLRLDRFRPLALPRPDRDGTDSEAPVRLLSVGRAVPKKGFDLLLEALARLPPERAWTWTHIGGGPELATLQRQAETLGLAARLRWQGPQAQEAVLDAYRDADLFVLPCRIAADGDRDGLPNVLVEAQSQGLACVSTTVSGVVELIEDDRNGLLVPPDAPESLAVALAALIADPQRRKRLGQAGQRRVAAEFDARSATARLMDLFAPVLGDPHG
ncbi:glycosyltransferase [Lichenihabitans sp. Uapishka_5]|uniref:glycosyltransferase family 4 protein n=1 Tax=Lichenihabitans sp. Uapishka_5 TaxID=3037302 RepID=UPI0029E7ED8C|nr:glycosyltransferase [Lichenihabitans sp. Uapishka_5]MDX7950626.1 glycosyltransferase [Lichenihabitans sp. Uapishka_5]